MTKEEFLLKKVKIEKTYKQELIQLKKDCAFFGNKIEIGMIIKEKECAIKVDKIEIYIIGGFPTLMFSGLTQKSNGELKKFPQRDSLLKSDSLKIIS